MELEKLQCKLQSLSTQHKMLLEKLNSSDDENDIHEKIKDLQQEVTTFSQEQKEVIEKIRSSVKFPDEENSQPINGEGTVKQHTKFPIEEDGGTFKVAPIKVPNFKVLHQRNWSSLIRSDEAARGANHSPKSTEDGSPKRNKKEYRTKKRRRVDSPEQDNFLEKLGLVSQEKFAELKFKQQDRKKRIRSVPSYLLLFATEVDKGHRSSDESSDSEQSNKESSNKKKRDNSSKYTSLLPIKKKRKRQKQPEIIPLNASIITSSEGADIHDFHELLCSVCHDAGNLLMCDTCDRVYHLTCLRPSLSRVPPGTWFCPKCVQRLAKLELPDVQMLKTTLATEDHKKVLQSRREAALTEALEIRRQRHNFGVQIKQFTSTHAKQTQAKTVSLETIEHLTESIVRIKEFLSLINVN